MHPPPQFYKPSEGSHPMRNAKQLQSKSRKHQVKQLTATTYSVTSGSSGKSYQVAQLQTGFTCSCSWGQYRKRNDPRSGCSHTIAVTDYLASWEGRRVSAWSSEEQARKQHKPIDNGLGDNLVLTHRKVSEPAILVNWPTGQVITLEVEQVA